MFQVRQERFKLDLRGQHFHRGVHIRHELPGRMIYTITDWKSLEECGQAQASEASWVRQLDWLGWRPVSVLS